MIATLVIGLREGLEAALIVGIIAAFLRRNGHSLKAMWVGVVAAVILSIAVGVALEAVSLSLPQAQQEGMEAIIGAVAIVFVTTMIVWMNTHAKAMKRELEASAGAALRDGTALALAGMAFLAVLKEGFETSVFLLATFQSSTSALSAGAGAVIGVLIAVAIGIGIFYGGVRLNLSRFFTVTGIFLVFVAAGLVVSMLRTAHEAGWITVGQQQTVDLSWLAPNGSVQAALITGVLGIPSDPRAIEVLGWFLYLIPVLAYCLWPRSMRPSPAKVPAFQLWLAAALAACAVILAVAVPATAAAAVPPYAQLAGGGTLSARAAGAGMTAELHRNDLRETLRFDANQRADSVRAGVAADRWRTQSATAPKDRPRTVTIADLVELENGRLPVGVNAQMNPGPFRAAWAEHTTTSLWTVDGRLLDAASSSTTVLTISGGGLPTARTFSVPAASDDWRVASSSTNAAAAAITAAADAAREALLVKLYLPIGLVIAAVILAIRALITRSARRRGEHGPAAGPAPETTRSTAPQTRSTSYAAK